MQHPFFTIGHSTRTIPEFAALLQAAAVQLVVDVRTVPRSRTNPQYNQNALPENLAPHQIGYEHMAALGGLRGKAKSQPPELNGFWQNQSFHNYADYALTPDFAEGFRRLVERGRGRRLAIMCSEAVWWRCHRRIISDYLLAQGEAVFHLMGEDRIEPAKLTEGAVVRNDGSIVYPAPDAASG
jgi:uncharacterized protein (DUF488 family)